MPVFTSFWLFIIKLWQFVKIVVCKNMRENTLGRRKINAAIVIGVLHWFFVKQHKIQTVTAFLCFLPYLYFLVLHKKIQSKILITMAASIFLLSRVYFLMFLQSTIFTNCLSFVMNTQKEVKTGQKLVSGTLLTLNLF